MFIINQFGRVVDLPENMEEEGFKQAKEVLSISDSLMDNGEYSQMTSQGVLNSKSGKHLRDEIIAKFPNVMKDSEYIELQKSKLNQIKDEPTANVKTTKVSSAKQKNR